MNIQLFLSDSLDSKSQENDMNGPGLVFKRSESGVTREKLSLANLNLF